LIRHAESESNSGLATADPASIALTARGHEQAEYIAQALPGQPSLLVLSPFLRARQSAQPTITRFPLTPQQVWPVQEFTYLARFHGTPTTTAQRRQAVEAYWQRGDPWYQDGEAAESFAQFVERTHKTLDRLRAFREGLVVVFTHEMFMRAIYWALLSASFEVSAEYMHGIREFRLGLRIPNAAIARVGFEASGNTWLGTITTTHLPATLTT
jgi:broad specificity phosphatase PhoE